MDSTLYDEYYYAHDCGRPYQRDESWLGFFDRIAARLIELYEPKTVLDAGCAWGFLVEAFRTRGVEAYGIDISEYAIQNVHPSIQPYCRVGSITESFGQTYDMITNIEVLEHMPPAEAEKAMENLCAHTGQVIFSSTPFDYKEVTHFNVHDPEVWAGQFARFGFYRDIDADLSFITPWAGRFVQEKRTNVILVQEYERKFWQLRKENLDLRQLSTEFQSKLKEQESQLTGLSARMGEQENQLQDLSARASAGTAAQAELEAIHATRTWKLLQPARRLYARLRRPGS